MTERAEGRIPAPLGYARGNSCKKRNFGDFSAQAHVSTLILLQLAGDKVSL